MDAKLLFIPNRYFLQPTEDALRRVAPDLETAVLPYDTLAQIPQIYAQHADTYDAVFVTGSSARHVIERSFPDEKRPLVVYQVDSDALHRTILRLALDTQSPDFHRIALDFLLPMEHSFSVADFLRLENAEENIEEVLRQNERLAELALVPQGQSPEEVLLARIDALWQSNAIDRVLCLYASLVPGLTARGIPFSCPFISDGHLKRLIHDVLMRLELNRLHENHPAIIQLFPRRSSPDEGEQMHRLHAEVQRFVRENLLDCVLQETENCCVLITSMKLLRALTDEFRTCRLSAYLRERLEFPVAVGYGVGTTVPHAMNNVQIASKEAKLAGQPFVVDSNGTLIGPLDSARRMVVSSQSPSDVSAVAKRCGLSTMTIRKLLSIVRSNGSNKITTQELAQRLGTTVRNADRIILNLCRGGAAKPVYTHNGHSRGRPIRVYALDFGTGSERHDTEEFPKSG